MLKVPFVKVGSSLIEERVTLTVEVLSVALVKSSALIVSILIVSNTTVPREASSLCPSHNSRLNEVG